MNDRFSRVREILLNSDETAFFFVTLPLSLPIAVVKRFIKMVQAYDIPVGGVIVNQIIPKSIGEAEMATAYIRNKYREQLHYMEIIERDLGELVVSYIPMYPSEVVGVEMVAKVARDLLEYEPDFLDEVRGHSGT